MIDTKFFCTLVGLAVAVFAACNIKPKECRENFWGNPGRKVKVLREVRSPNGQVSNLQNNWQSMLTNDKFISTPSYQAILEPRFANADFGANIRYNMPSNKNMAAPCNPLTFGAMATENYSNKPSQARHQSQANKQVKENYGCASGSCGGGCGAASCARGGLPIAASRNANSCGDGGIPESGFAAGDFNNVMGNVYGGNVGGTNSMLSPTATIPVGDMTTVNGEGTVTQPIIYDRFIYANQQSRLRAQGDPIRGDLAIVPCNNGWFNPAVNPNIDLHEGALNVMGGMNNDTAKSLGNLIYATSGNSETVFAGADMAGQFGPRGAMNLNMGNQFSTSLSAGQRDVGIASFP